MNSTTTKLTDPTQTTRAPANTEPPLGPRLTPCPVIARSSTTWQSTAKTEQPPAIRRHATLPVKKDHGYLQLGQNSEKLSGQIICFECIFARRDVSVVDHRNS